MSQDKNQAIHEPFSWLPKGSAIDANARFAERAKNLADGIIACAGILHIDMLKQGDPILDDADTDRMMRFVIEAGSIIADLAEERIDAAFKQIKKKDGAA